MERYEDLDEYGWLTKEEDCPTPSQECNGKCPMFNACYIHVVEEARKGK
mgnify:CR=1 FL=1